MLNTTETNSRIFSSSHQPEKNKFFGKIKDNFKLTFSDQPKRNSFFDKTFVSCEKGKYKYFFHLFFLDKCKNWSLESSLTIISECEILSGFSLYIIEEWYIYIFKKK